MRLSGNGHAELAVVAWWTLITTTTLLIISTVPTHVLASLPHTLKTIRLLSSEAESFELGAHAPWHFKLFVNIGKDDARLQKLKQIQERFYRHGLVVVGFAEPVDALSLERVLKIADVEKSEHQVRVVQKRQEEAWKLHDWLASFSSAPFNDDFQSFLVDPSDNFVSRFDPEDLDVAFQVMRDEPTMVQEVEHLVKFHGLFKHEL